jgi:hypothetical protein
MYAEYIYFYQRLDARCRCVSVVSYDGVSTDLLAWFGIDVGGAMCVATLGIVSRLCSRSCAGSHTMHIWNILPVSRQHASPLSASVCNVLSRGIPSLLSAVRGILCRCHHVLRRETIFFMNVEPGVTYLRIL